MVQIKSIKEAKDQSHERLTKSYACNIVEEAGAKRETPARLTRPNVQKAERKSYESKQVTILDQVIKASE